MKIENMNMSLNTSRKFVSYCKGKLFSLQWHINKYKHGNKKNAVKHFKLKDVN